MNNIFEIKQYKKKRFIDLASKFLNNVFMYFESLFSELKLQVFEVFHLN